MATPMCVCEEMAQPMPSIFCGRSIGPNDRRLRLHQGFLHSLVDHTSLGWPVLEDLRASGLTNAVGITFTAGHQVKHHGQDFLVPKTEFVSSLRVAVENGRIATAAIPMRDVLEGELQNLKRKTKLSGHESIEAGTDWREHDHDDLVFSLAMAIWSAEEVDPVTRQAQMDALLNAWTW
jgi:hypothetical protein